MPSPLRGSAPGTRRGPRLLGRLQCPSPAAGVRGRGGDGEVAGHPEPGVDALGLAPRADLTRRTAHVHQQTLARRPFPYVSMRSTMRPHQPVAQAAVPFARPSTAQTSCSSSTMSSPAIAFPGGTTLSYTAAVAAPEDHDVCGRIWLPGGGTRCPRTPRGQAPRRSDQLRPRSGGGSSSGISRGIQFSRLGAPVATASVWTCTRRFNMNGRLAAEPPPQLGSHRGPERAPARA